MSPHGLPEYREHTHTDFILPVEVTYERDGDNEYGIVLGATYHLRRELPPALAQCLKYDKAIDGWYAVPSEEKTILAVCNEVFTLSVTLGFKVTSTGL